MKLAASRNPPNLRLLIDTVLEASSTSGTSVDPIQRIALGSYGGSNQFLDRTVAEVLVYDGPLSQVDTMIIRDYLMKKYLGTRLDGDGLPDLWEMQWFGTLGASSGGSDDFDSDGRTDVREWLAGSDPTDRGSQGVQLNIALVSCNL